MGVTGGSPVGVAARDEPGQPPGQLVTRTTRRRSSLRWKRSVEFRMWARSRQILQSHGATYTLWTPAVLTRCDRPATLTVILIFPATRWQSSESLTAQRNATCERPFTVWSELLGFCAGRLYRATPAPAVGQGLTTAWDRRWPILGDYYLANQGGYQNDAGQFPDGSTRYAWYWRPGHSAGGVIAKFRQ